MRAFACNVRAYNLDCVPCKCVPAMHCVQHKQVTLVHCGQRTQHLKSQTIGAVWLIFNNPILDFLGNLERSHQYKIRKSQKFLNLIIIKHVTAKKFPKKVKNRGIRLHSRILPFFGHFLAVPHLIMIGF